MSGSTPASTAELSFIISIQALGPNYDEQEVRVTTDQRFWIPPNIRTAYLAGVLTHFRWRNGTITYLAPNDVPPNLEQWRYSCATIFTQQPYTSHLLAVDFDARERDVRGYLHEWERLFFDDKAIPNGPTYSFISRHGEHMTLPAPAAPNWAQLLPDIYNYKPVNNSAGHPTEQPAQSPGMVGDLPLLIALAAFSAHPAVLVSTLTQCIRPNRWIRHSKESGHRPERGMVVTIYFDPTDPQRSTHVKLNNLENGVYGPFYGP